MSLRFRIDSLSAAFPSGVPMDSLRADAKLLMFVETSVRFLTRSSMSTTSTTFFIVSPSFSGGGCEPIFTSRYLSPRSPVAFIPTEASEYSTTFLSILSVSLALPFLSSIFSMVPASTPATFILVFSSRPPIFLNSA